MTRTVPFRSAAEARRHVLPPLSLAQFVCSFAGSNMNVMISDISRDLDTTTHGVQVVITVFLLVMAALMIPGGRLADLHGRKRCLVAGLLVYGTGTLLSALAPGLGVLLLGYSLLEGVGTALLIPPVYILTTLLFTEVASRARAFGTIMAMAGCGAAAGPLLGGLIASALGWRAAFLFQTLLVVVIVVLARRVPDPLPPDPALSFDTRGAVLSALGLCLVVTGILATAQNAWAALALFCLGALVLAWFLRSQRERERRGGQPLLSTSLFRNRVSDLGLVTQGTQWMMLMGVSFTAAAYLQVVRGYSSIGTGVVFTAATVGLLTTSLAAQRLARRRPQRTLIMAGFAVTVAGIGVLLLTGGARGAWAATPGLFLIGAGLGGMLTPSVNVVQSAFDESRQGEISGLSRSVSNLGSSLGTAVAGTILVIGLDSRAYATALAATALAGAVGFTAAALLPRTPAPGGPPASQKSSAP